MGDGTKRYLVDYFRPWSVQDREWGGGDVANGDANQAGINGASAAVFAGNITQHFEAGPTFSWIRGESAGTRYRVQFAGDVNVIDTYVYPDPSVPVIGIQLVCNINAIARDMMMALNFWQGVEYAGLPRAQAPTGELLDLGNGSKRFSWAVYDIGQWSIDDKDKNGPIGLTAQIQLARNGADALNMVANFQTAYAQSARYRADYLNPTTVKDYEVTPTAVITGCVDVDSAFLIAAALNFWEGLYMAGITSRSNDG
jgi:hypothetical protein